MNLKTLKKYLPSFLIGLLGGLFIFVVANDFSEFVGTIMDYALTFVSYVLSYILPATNDFIGLGIGFFVYSLPPFIVYAATPSFIRKVKSGGFLFFLFSLLAFFLGFIIAFMLFLLLIARAFSNFQFPA